jgi:TetR/AcrR family transcriptional regulator
MDAEQLPRREREKLRKRSEMLEAALGLFSEKGYHNVSMHEVARKGEFSIGTVYKFFKNKEDLYQSLLMTKAEEFHRRLNKVLDKKAEPLTLLKNFLASKGDFFAGNVAIVRLYFAETHGASYNVRSALEQDMRSLYDDLLNKLASIFKAGIKNNTFRHLDPYYMAVALDGTSNAFLFSWLESPKRHPYKRNVRMILNIFLEGVLAK